MANKWVDLGDVWSGRDLAEGERVTVSVFDKAKQTVLEQTTFVAKAGRLDQFTWVMDLCGQVNATLKLVCAGVQVGDKLEIQSSGYLNKYWGVTASEVQVITTAARHNNWTTDKRVNIDLTEDTRVGSTLQLKVHNAKGQLLETVSFKSRPGRSTLGLCAKDFATEINDKSLYVRAGSRSGNQIDPVWEQAQNWIWIPFNADFTVTWSLDSTGAWTELGEVWSGRALAEGERVTVSVFDKATQAVLEQTTFVAKAGRLDQFIWVMDLCEQINAQLKLIRAQDADNGEWLIRESGYLNKYWGITERDVQVITTTARDNNWPSEKRVNLDIGEDLVTGATLHLKVCNAKKALLETISFKVMHGRNAPGPCAQDFANQINKTSLYVRAGSKAGSQPSAKALDNWIWMPFNADFTVSWSVELPSLIELGEVWSGRDLAEGERVTLSVFDRVSKTLLEQVSFRPAPQRNARYTWVADFCRYINSHSTLIRAGTRNDKGRWEVLGSGDQNHYWSFCSRVLTVVTTVAHKNNWSTAKRVPVHASNDLTAGSVVRVNVRGAAGELLETVTFSPSPTRLTPGLWTKDLAIQINNSSLFVRAGRASEHLLEPWHDRSANYIWIPQNSDLSVTWSVDELKDGGKILADRDARDGERISLLVFDSVADKLLHRITLNATADKNRLKKDQWPADLAKQINASSGHARAGERSGSTFTPKESASGNVICQRYAELRTFTTALHLDNWVQGETLLAAADLRAADCIVVKVTTARKGNFCEVLTFTPDPGRLGMAQWVHDLAAHISKYSFYLKAGVKNDTSKLIAPQENASSNLIWLPKDSGLKVSWDITQLKNLGYISSQRELRVNEGCKAFVLDDGSDEILREITFSATAGRTGTSLAPKDLALWINGRTQLIVAGERKGTVRPAPVASSYLNTLWGCTSEIRAFTTFMSLKNWDKGAPIAERDLFDDEQVVVIVKGTKSGRILESMNFTPKPGRGSRHLWGKDLSVQLNTRSRFIRGGEENTTLFLMEPMHKVDVNHFWTPKGSGLEVEMHILSGIPGVLPQSNILAAIWSGYDLPPGERVTVSVFDKATQALLEQTVFVSKAGRVDPHTWVTDLCGQVNGRLKLVRAGVPTSERLEVDPVGELNYICNITERDLMVVITTPRSQNWTTAKRVNIDLSEDVMPGATLQLKVTNSKGALLETLSFTPTEGRNTPGFCSKDFALAINQASLYVRAGAKSGSEIKPLAERLQNWIWIPVNADFRVSWSIVPAKNDDWPIVIPGSEGSLPPALPEALPGMSSEAKALFDKCSESRKLITVDARTGLPSLNIPVVDLFADDSFSHPFKVGLAFNADEGVHIRLGGGERRVSVAKEKESKEYILTLRDGRGVRVDNALVALNGGDFKIEPEYVFLIENSIDLEIKTGFSIIYKDGVVETFYFRDLDLRYPKKSHMSTNVNLASYTLPTGGCLEFSYDGHRVKEVTRDKKTLLRVAWEFSENSENAKENPVATPASITIYPDGKDEKITWNFFEQWEGDKTVDFYVDGFSTENVIFYALTLDEHSRLSRLDMQHRLSADMKKTSESDDVQYLHEELTYNDDGKVDRHVISLDVDDLIHDYTYATDTTCLTGYFETMEPRTAFVRTYRFTGGQGFTDEYGSKAVPIKKSSSHLLDKDKKVLVSETITWEGDVAVDKQSLTLDAVGNPISRSEGETIRYWTYYNNYQQFRVTETATHVEDWSLFGVLFKGVDYINSIGVGFALGGSSGLTWGTRIKTEVEMLPATNDYAKNAFNLPVAIIHGGSDLPFASDVESELVCQRIDGNEVPQRLSFFGYETITNRTRTRIKHKLTILQPDCTRVDVVDKQLVVAKAAAKNFVDSLTEQINQASDKSEKKVYQDVLKDLNRSIEAQSKLNGEGFKLNSWKAGSMSLDTFEYHTEAGKPGYGTIKSLETVLLDVKGKVIETSRRKTSYDYSVDATDSSRLTIKTTISRSGTTSIESSQVRSRYTGRLLESVDSEGVKTVWTFDPHGNLKTEKISKGDTTLRETSVVEEKGPQYLYTMVEDGITTRMVVDDMGRKKSLSMVTVVEEEKEGEKLQKELQNELQSWTYDQQGRIASMKETDYGKDNKQIAQRETTWTYDELTGQVTQSLSLTVGDKTTTTVQTRVPSLKGERFTQGDFSVDRQYVPGTGVMSETYATKDKGGCRIERTLSADGRLKSVCYLTVDKDDTASEHDRTDFTYDTYGQLSTATPKLGAASSYTHDPAGRLLSTTRDGVDLTNTYDASSLAPVSAESHVKKGDSSFSLGKQTVDMLGRSTSQTVNGQTTGYSYNGASRQAAFKTAGKAPAAMAGYSSSIDKATRTHTQTVGGKTSTLVFTTGGRVQTFTDLTGSVTTYEYDFFNRVIGSSNDQCVCTFTYADSGLLISESIKAVNAGNLTMKVDYSYDQLGQEISRSFNCEGIDTLTLERTLLADGRLSKSTLKSAKTVNGEVTETEVHSDSYEYNQSLRLSKWIGSDCPKAEAEGPWTEWTYDALGSIASFKDSSGALVKSFVFKTPKLEQPSSCLTMNATTYVSDHSMSYDSAGHMTRDCWQNKWTYYGNGQVKSCCRYSDGYDYDFSYDSEGRVRGCTYKTDVDTYHYRGDSVYALVQTMRPTGDARRTMVLRNESRACLMQDAIWGDTILRSFELRDANGTVFASIDLSSKAIILFRYEPYGARYSGRKEETWLGFKGEPLNVLGFYHLGNGFRMYDPKLGRFLSPDPRSPFGVGGAAAYAFCNGDPVNHADPNGHQVIAQYERWGSAPAIYSTAFRVVVGAVGVLLAPFTAGTSVLIAVATTALAAISFAFDMASLIISESDPELSKTLEAWGQVFGLASAAAGIALTLHGFKGIPRNLFGTRGGGNTARLVKWPKTPSELRVAQQARSKALTQLIQGADEAKASGTFDAFKAKHFNPEGGIGNAVTAGIPASSRFTQRAGNAGKDLFKGIIREFDDSLFDYLGTTLDFNSGPNMLVQKFIAPPLSQTEIIAIVAAALPGRENLFK